jgi:replication factor A3
MRRQKQEAHLQLNNAAEIIGKVQPDLSVRVLQATDFGAGLDYVAANAVVECTHRYKEIFYEVQ